MRNFLPKVSFFLYQIFCFTNIAYKKLWWQSKTLAQIKDLERLNCLWTVVVGPGQVRSAIFGLGSENFS